MRLCYSYAYLALHLADAQGVGHLLVWHAVLGQRVHIVTTAGVAHATCPSIEVKHGVGASLHVPEVLGSHEIGIGIGDSREGYGTLGLDSDAEALTVAQGELAQAFAI